MAGIGPTDATSAVIVEKGELLVIDGRGVPWKYVPGKKKPPGQGLPVNEPSGFLAAWASSDRLGVIDEDEVAWDYSFSTGAWTKGPKVEVIKSDPPSEASWQACYPLVPAPAPEPAEATPT